MEKKKQKTKIVKKVGILAVSTLLVVLSLVVPCSAYTYTDGNGNTNIRHSAIEFSDMTIVRKNDPNATSEFYNYDFPHKAYQDGINTHSIVPISNSILNGYNDSIGNYYRGRIVYSGNYIQEPGTMDIEIPYDMGVYFSNGTQTYHAERIKFYQNNDMGTYRVTLISGNNEVEIMNNTSGNVINYPYFDVEWYGDRTLTLDEVLYQFYVDGYWTYENYQIISMILVNSSIRMIQDADTGEWSMYDTNQTITYQGTFENGNNYQMQYLDFNLTKLGLGTVDEYGGDYYYNLRFNIEDSVIQYSDFPNRLPKILFSGEHNVRQYVTLNFTYFTQTPVIDENGDSYNLIEKKTKTVTYSFEEYLIEYAYMIPDITNDAEITGIFNATDDKVLISGDVQFIIEVPEVSRDYDLNVRVIQYYTKDSDTIQTWLDDKLGTVYQHITNRPIQVDTNLIDWLSSTVGGFLNTQIFSGITIGHIIWFTIGIGGLFAILKFFSGG